MVKPTYEFVVGDYVRFRRIVKAKQDKGNEVDPYTGRLMVSPMVPEQILDQHGVGQILKFAAKPRKVKRLTASGNVKIDVVQVATVAAGRGLGNVTAVLNDATLEAKQETMDLGLFADAEAGSMYSTDIKGHQ